MGSSSSSQRAGRSSTVTPCTPSGGMTWLPGGSSAPSTTSRMCGTGARSSAPKRGRSARSAGSSAARSLSEVETIRIGPTASDCWALWPCGSHLTQSQWARVWSVASTATTRWSGEWNAVAEQTIARASATGLVLVAADLDAVEGPQVDRGGQVGLHAVHHQQPVQRRGGGRVDLVDGGALRRHQLQGQRLLVDAVADLEEVGVGRALLPQPRALLGQRGQRAGVGVVPGQGPALLVGGLAGHLAHVAEVAQVLGARARDLLGALLPLPVDLHDDEAEGGEEEHAGGDVLPAAAARLPPLIVATSTIEPRLPSIGIAFISTPEAPSDCSICGGGCRTIWPEGISGSSTRPLPSVVLVMAEMIGAQGPCRGLRLHPVSRGERCSREVGRGRQRRRGQSRAHRARTRRGLDLMVPPRGAGRRRRRRVRRAVPPGRGAAAAHRARGAPLPPDRSHRRGRRHHRRRARGGRAASARARPGAAAPQRAGQPAPLAGPVVALRRGRGAGGLAGWLRGPRGRPPARRRDRPAGVLGPAWACCRWAASARPGPRRPRRSPARRRSPCSGAPCPSGCPPSSGWRPWSPRSPRRWPARWTAESDEALRVWIVGRGRRLPARRRVRPGRLGRPQVVWALLLVAGHARRPARAGPRRRRPRPVPPRPRAARGHRLVGPRAARRAPRPHRRARRRRGGRRRARHPGGHRGGAPRCWWSARSPRRCCWPRRPCRSTASAPACMVVLVRGRAAPGRPQLPPPGRPGPAARRGPDLLGGAARRPARPRAAPWRSARCPRSWCSCSARCWCWSPSPPAAAGARRGGRDAPRSPRAWPVGGARGHRRRGRSVPRAVGIEVPGLAPSRPGTPLLVRHRAPRRSRPADPDSGDRRRSRKEWRHGQR